MPTLISAPAQARSSTPALICVSHREPFAVRRAGSSERLVRTTGGLVTALDSALRSMGGAWIAAGHEARKLEAPVDEQGRSYRIDELGLSTRSLDAYYSGFSNRVLWPLFHYFIDHVRFDEREWLEYQRVNRRFAASIVEALESGEPSSVVWIHDYHLLLAPRRVRAQVPEAALGFFLHVPFPAWEVFRILPMRQELLEGMLGANLLGFHTNGYRQAFLSCCRRILGARVEGTTVHFEGRRIQTVCAPIGIDVAQQRLLSQKPLTASRAARLRRSMLGDKLVLGVDRLDYTKGLPERLRGIDRLFERFPEHRGRVTLLQIAVPSRTKVEEYQRLKRGVDEEVGRINGRWGDGAWTPIRYVTRSFSAEELAACYRAADVALVTPLRDGLNLVAKEYVACHGGSDGALVLSEFAGASEELSHAYVVNPFGPDSIAEGLHRALTDDRLDRERRMRAMVRQVEVNDVNHWARRFVTRIHRAAQSPHSLH